MANPVPVVTVAVDANEMEDLARRVLPEQVERGLRRTALLIEAKAVQLAPHKTTNLKNSGTTEFRGRGFDASANVKFTAQYALYVHEGTGIFGPKARRIRPVRAKALMIPLPDGSVIFRSSVKGMLGRPFLKLAFEMEGPKLVPRILEG